MTRVFNTFVFRTHIIDLFRRNPNIMKNKKIRVSNEGFVVEYRSKDSKLRILQIEYREKKWEKKFLSIL